jgi:hypothetical protein
MALDVERTVEQRLSQDRLTAVPVMDGTSELPDVLSKL